MEGLGNEEKPGLANETKIDTRNNSKTTGKANHANIGAGTMKKNNTPAAPDPTRQALDDIKARHAETVTTLRESTANLAALNARLEDGDDTVTLDEIWHAERAVGRLTQLAEGQAKRVTQAETEHRIASADLRLADRLLSPLNALPRAWYDSAGTLYKGTPFYFVSAPWHNLTSQHGIQSVQGEERLVIYVSQDAPTKRDARTGVESGSVIFAVPAGLHLPIQADRWLAAASTVGMSIGERGLHFSRSLGLSTKEGQMTTADGTDYDLHRIAVEEAMPNVPVITSTALVSDSDAWGGILVEQIEHRATVELRYGNPVPFVRDARLTLRACTPSEAMDGHRVTRTVHAAGLATINPSDTFDDLSRFIIAPLVEEWLTGQGIFRGLTPGLGRAVKMDVKLDPLGRGQASVTIHAAFVSTSS